MTRADETIRCRRRRAWRAGLLVAAMPGALLAQDSVKQAADPGGSVAERSARRARLTLYRLGRPYRER